MDIEAWKQKLEGGEPEEWCPGVAGPVLRPTGRLLILYENIRRCPRHFN